MPRRNSSKDEAVSPRTKQSTEENAETVEINNSFKEREQEREKDEENSKEIELLSDSFMNCWYNQDTKHPGILYHLSRSEAFEGFELYHTDRKGFALWKSYRLKKKVVAPYPINSPPTYKTFVTITRTTPLSAISPLPRIVISSNKDRYAKLVRGKA